MRLLISSIVILTILKSGVSQNPQDLFDSEEITDQDNHTEYPNGVNVIPGVAGRDYPILHSIPRSSFSCRGRLPGFYADTELRCQVWHICDHESRQLDFLCTNGTIYSQRKRVCDWWYNVICDESNVEKNYERNKYLWDEDYNGSDYDFDNEERNYNPFRANGDGEKRPSQVSPKPVKSETKPPINEVTKPPTVQPRVQSSPTVNQLRPRKVPKPTQRTVSSVPKRQRQQISSNSRQVSVPAPAARPLNVDTKKFVVKLNPAAFNGKRPSEAEVKKHLFKFIEEQIRLGRLPPSYRDSARIKLTPYKDATNSQPKAVIHLTPDASGQTVKNPVIHVHEKKQTAHKPLADQYRRAPVSPRPVLTSTKKQNTPISVKPTKVPVVRTTPRHVQKTPATSPRPSYKSTKTTHNSFGSTPSPSLSRLNAIPVTQLPSKQHNVVSKKSKTPIPPSSPKKFRHSTPVKHNVHFASKARAAEILADEDEIQLISESQRPAIPYSLNGFRRFVAIPAKTHYPQKVIEVPEERTDFDGEEESSEEEEKKEVEREEPRRRQPFQPSRHAHSHIARRPQPLAPSEPEVKRLKVTSRKAIEIKTPTQKAIPPTTVRTTPSTTVLPPYKPSKSFRQSIYRQVNPIQESSQDREETLVQAESVFSNPYEQSSRKTDEKNVEQKNEDTSRRVNHARPRYEQSYQFRRPSTPRRAQTITTATTTTTTTTAQPPVEENYSYSQENSKPRKVKKLRKKVKKPAYDIPLSESQALGLDAEDEAYILAQLQEIAKEFGRRL